MKLLPLLLEYNFGVLCASVGKKQHMKLKKQDRTCSNLLNFLKLRPICSPTYKFGSSFNLTAFLCSFYSEWGFCWRSPFTHRSAIRRDDSRHKETLPILQEWPHRCPKRPGSGRHYFHLLCCFVSCHHLWRPAGCVTKSKSAFIFQIESLNNF